MVNLVQAVKKVDFPTAKRIVSPDTPEAMIATLMTIAERALSVDRGKKLELPGPYPYKNMEYMYGRGFTDDTLKKFGAGWVDSETFRLKDRGFTIRAHVALPIRASSGHLQAYVYRNTAPGNLRYMYSPGAPLASLWFGLHLAPRGGDIVVTEGSMDAMWVTQCGCPAIAALGATADYKIHQLMRYERVILFMDRDAAGVHAAERIGKLIAHKMPVLVARYPKKAVTLKDPADLSQREVRRAIARAVPYLSWANALAGA